MKIVVLSGSPHRSGTTSRLADGFIKGAREAGHEITRFDTAFMNIHPCIACDECLASDDARCIYADDMTAIAAALAEADCIAFVTPIYYYGICSQLKTVIDRFYGIEASIRKNQKAVFITAMADDNVPRIDPANASYRAVIEWMGWQDCGIVNAFECSTPDDLAGKDYEEKAYMLGRSIG